MILLKEGTVITNTSGHSSSASSTSSLNRRAVSPKRRAISDRAYVLKRLGVRTRGRSPGEIAAELWSILKTPDYQNLYMQNRRLYMNTIAAAKYYDSKHYNTPLV